VIDNQSPIATKEQTMRKKISRKSKPTKGPSHLSLFQTLMFGVGFYLICVLGGETMNGTSVHAQNTQLPFRQIGSQSMVDRYQTNGGYQTNGNEQRDNQRLDQRLDQNFNAANQSFRQTAYQYNRSGQSGDLRQVAMQSGGFNLPQDIGGGPPSSPTPNQFAPPPLNTPPALQPQTKPNQTAPLSAAPQRQAPPQTGTPSQMGFPSPSSPVAPQTLAPNNLSPQYASPQNDLRSASPAPRSLPTYQAPPLADYQPLAPPQITNGGFATMGDCRLISAPSSYTAMSPYGSGCGSGVSPASFNGAYTNGSYAPPPAQIAAPAMMPSTGFVPTNPTLAVPGTSGTLATASSAPIGSLVSFGQENNPVQVGQGLWGQPVAYVPGQSFRNWLRYLSF
jgi:hypothetical protein